MTANVTIKLRLRDEIHRLTVDGGITIDALHKHLGTVFADTLPKKYTLKYLDDDEDMVTVCSNIELDEAIQWALSQKKPLRLFIFDVTQPAFPETPAGRPQLPTLPPQATALNATALDLSRQILASMLTPVAIAKTDGASLANRAATATLAPAIAREKDAGATADDIVTPQLIESLAPAVGEVLTSSINEILPRFLACVFPLVSQMQDTHSEMSKLPQVLSNLIKQQQDAQNAGTDRANLGNYDDDHGPVPPSPTVPDLYPSLAPLFSTLFAQQQGDLGDRPGNLRRSKIAQQPATPAAQQQATPQQPQSTPPPVVPTATFTPTVLPPLTFAPAGTPTNYVPHVPSNNYNPSHYNNYNNATNASPMFSSLVPPPASPFNSASTSGTSPRNFNPPPFNMAPLAQNPSPMLHSSNSGNNIPTQYTSSSPPTTSMMLGGKRLDARCTVAATPGTHNNTMAATAMPGTNNNNAEESHLVCAEKFVRKWTWKNEGEAEWPTGCLMRFISGESFAFPAEGVRIPQLIKTGESVEISVELTAPRLAASYVGSYGLCLPTGEKFGPRAWLHVRVSDPKQDLSFINNRGKAPTTSAPMRIPGSSNNPAQQQHSASYTPTRSGTTPPTSLPSNNLSPVPLTMSSEIVPTVLPSSSYPPFASTSSGSVPTNTSTPPEWESLLESMGSMGFLDRAANLAALRRHNGDVFQAVSDLS